jgi:ABC-type polysaccharide transport system permease subunit
MKISIKEKSLVARFAAYLLHEDRMAVVIGKTIYLWNTSRHDFLKNKKWFHHELMHIQQFKQYGFIKFLFLYLLESLKNGYYSNRFEIEAREKENDLVPVIKTIIK